MTRNASRFLATAALALALAACGEQEPTQYEPDAEDLSGGELQMADPDAEGVEVDLPETPMTNVPADEVPEDVEGGAAE